MVDRYHMSSVQVAEWGNRIGVTHGGGQLKAFCHGCGMITFLFLVVKNIVSFPECVSGGLQPWPEPI